MAFSWLQRRLALWSAYLEDENKTFAMVMGFCVLLLFPVVVTPLINYDHLFPISDDTRYSLKESNFYAESSSSIAFALLPTLVDTLFDIMRAVVDRLNKGANIFSAMSADPDVSTVEVSDMAKVKTTRLAVYERLVFIVGVSLPSLVVLGAPPEMSETHLFAAYLTAKNLRNLLTFAPILAFLQRCTTTFTPLRVFTIQIVACVGLVIDEIGWMYVPESPENNLCITLGFLLPVLSIILYFALCLLTLYKTMAPYLEQAWEEVLYFFGWVKPMESESTHGPSQNAAPSNRTQQKRGAVTFSKQSDAGPLRKSTVFGFNFVRFASFKFGAHTHAKKNGGEGEEDAIQRRIKSIDAFYENYVPMAHMISGVLLFVAVLLPYVNLYSSSLKGDHTRAACNFVILALVVIIVFIENRVRHNEVERTMLRAMSSVKKSYVRYLSHELRTPLNTTWLGIKLLADEANAADEDERDEDRVEILTSMGTACKTACDILDNMVQFDKLESGILTLRKEPVQVRSFVTDCAAVFAADARHLNIDLRLMLDVSPQALRCLDELAAARLQPRLEGRSPLATTVPAAWQLTTPIKESDLLSADRAKLESVVCNLISHALKSCPNGSAITVAAWFVPDEEEQKNEAPVGALEGVCGPCLRGMSSPGKKGNSVRKTFAGADVASLSKGASVSETPASVPRVSRRCSGRLVIVVTDSDLNDDGIDPRGGATSIKINKSTKVAHGQSAKSGSKSSKTAGGGLAASGKGAQQSSIPSLSTAAASGAEQDSPPPRVQADILHFNPKKLVAGGGDEMSLWISNGVVGLHGGQMRLYVPDKEDQPETAAPASTGGEEKAKAAHAPHVMFSGHHGKTVVVELPLTRVLTPDDQLKLSRMDSALASREKSAGGHGNDDEDEDDEDEVWDPNDSSLSAQSSMSSMTSLLAAEKRDVVEECNAESFGPSRRVSHGPAFPGGQSRRASGMPMHLRNRHGSSWVALDEHAAVSRRASRAVIGMTFTAPTVKSNQASREGSRRPSHQGSRRPSVGHGARSSLTRSGSFEKGLQTLNTEAMLQAAANRIARLEASAEESAAKEAPVAVPNKATVVKPPEKATKPAAAASGPRKLLLVVDDSDLTRKMLCRIMKAQGYDYDEAEDGAVAVEKVERNIGDFALMESGYDTGRDVVVRPYSAILMDFVMPVMDGPTATEKIRAMGFSAPVFGVTGNGQDFDVARFLESGADKVFTKPLDVAAFKECMREAEAVASAAKRASLVAVVEHLTAQ